MVAYSEFLAGKRHLSGRHGFATVAVPPAMFDFQRALLEWSLLKGRAAVFADCGLGKSLLELAWADNVVRHTNRPVLILTPLAVAYQFPAEGEKFGIGCTRITSGSPPGPGVYVTNYEKLDKFDPSDWAGVVCDESSCLKDSDAVRTATVTEFMRRMSYRLLCTATAAPNDYDELGSSSEALGEMGYQDMLGMYFRQSTQKDRLGWGRTKYVMRGHAVRDFWRWVCSWSRACRKPSDLGFDDGPFRLPPLETVEHQVKARTARPGRLFDSPAENLQEEREEARRTIAERCERVAELVDHDRPAVAWCDLNDEGNTLTRLISGAVQVSGSDKDERKEEVFRAFSAGEVRVLVTKPQIAGYGLNWQHCSHQTFFPSHSFERYYQAVRRSWRFGQRSPVRVDLVTTDGRAGVLANLQRKAEQADAMFSNLVALMNDELQLSRTDRFQTKEVVPQWL